MTNVGRLKSKLINLLVQNKDANSKTKVKAVLNSMCYPHYVEIYILFYFKEVFRIQSQGKMDLVLRMNQFCTHIMCLRYVAPQDQFQGSSIKDQTDIK